MCTSCVDKVTIDPFSLLPSSGNVKQYDICEIKHDTGVLPIWCSKENADESVSKHGGPLLLYKEKLIRLTKNRITIYDKNDGAILDSIEIDEVDPYYDIFNSYQFTVLDKYLVLSYNNEKVVIYDIDAASKASEIEFSGSLENKHFAILDNRLFVLLTNNNIAKVVEVEPSTGQISDLININIISAMGQRPYLRSITAHKNQNGENLLVFPVIGNRGQDNQRIHVWAFDIDKRQYKWHANDLNIEYLQRNELICGVDNVAIAGSHLIVINKESGALELEKELDFYCSQTNLINSKLILYNDIDGIACYDLISKSFVWEKEKSSGLSTLSKCVNFGEKGIEIFSSVLLISDPQTGLVEKRVAMPFKKEYSSYFSYVIDYNDYTAYTADGKQIAAFDLSQL